MMRSNPQCSRTEVSLDPDADSKAIGQELNPPVGVVDRDIVKLQERIWSAFRDSEVGQEVAIGDVSGLVYLRNGTLKPIFPVPDRRTLGTAMAFGAGPSLERVNLTVKRTDTDLLLEFSATKKNGRSRTGTLQWDGEQYIQPRLVKARSKPKPITRSVIQEAAKHLLKQGVLEIDITPARIAEHLKINVARVSKTRNEPLLAVTPEKIERRSDVLKEKLRRSPSVQELAAAYGVSAHTLKRWFKEKGEELGTTPDSLELLDYHEVPKSESRKWLHNFVSKLDTPEKKTDAVELVLKACEKGTLGRTQAFALIRAISSGEVTRKAVDRPVAAILGVHPMFVHYSLHGSTRSRDIRVGAFELIDDLIRTRCQNGSENNLAYQCFAENYQSFRNLYIRANFFEEALRESSAGSALTRFLAQQIDVAPDYRSVKGVASGLKEIERRVLHAALRTGIPGFGLPLKDISKLSNVEIDIVQRLLNGERGTLGACARMNRVIAEELRTGRAPKCARHFTASGSLKDDICHTIYRMKGFAREKPRLFESLYGTLLQAATEVRFLPDLTVTLSGSGTSGKYHLSTDEKIGVLSDALSPQCRTLVDMRKMLQARLVAAGVATVSVTQLRGFLFSVFQKASVNEGAISILQGLLGKAPESGHVIVSASSENSSSSGEWLESQSSARIYYYSQALLSTEAIEEQSKHFQRFHQAGKGQAACLFNEFRRILRQSGGSSSDIDGLAMKFRYSEDKATSDKVVSELVEVIRGGREFSPRGDSLALLIRAAQKLHRGVTVEELAYLLYESHRRAGESETEGLVTGIAKLMGTTDAWLRKRKVHSYAEQLYALRPTMKDESETE